MAGIGFKLQNLYRYGTYTEIIHAYGYAGIISAGPWVISIIGIILLDFIRYTHTDLSDTINQFQTLVTYLIAITLILTSFAQHSFIRYISDQIYVCREDKIISNFNGLLLIMTVLAGSIAMGVSIFLFPHQSLFFRLTLSTCFVILCHIWLCANMLSGVKSYQAIVLTFFVGYSICVGTGYLFKSAGLEGLLAGFTIGQFILLSGMLWVIYTNYPIDKPIAFDFIKPGQFFPILIFVGLFYNLGIWIDKFVFWFTPTTSDPVLGIIRSSQIYDLPIFIAYLALLPGMAVFLFRLETDFVRYYHRFFNCIKHGGSLYEIQAIRDDMIISARTGIIDIVKVQALIAVIFFFMAEQILEILGLPTTHKYLLKVDVVGIGLQMVFLGILNILFYLDKRAHVFKLTLFFLILNFLFTMLTIQLGTFYFGYGFAASLLIVNVYGIYLLNQSLDNIIYETFNRN